MKLYEVPAGTKVKVLETNQIVFVYFNPNSNAPYYLNHKDEIVKLPHWTEVELVNGE